MQRSARAATAFALQGLVSAAVAFWARSGRAPSTGMTSVVTIVVACAAFAAVDAGAQVGDDPREIPRLDRTLAAVTSAGLALVMLGSVLGIASLGHAANVSRFVAGLVIASAGAALRGRAISVLGSSFVTGARPVERTRVARDVYALLRHPSEAGLWLIATGLFIVTHSWACGLGLSLVVISSVARMRREERFLRRLGSTNAA